MFTTGTYHMTRNEFGGSEDYGRDRPAIVLAHDPQGPGHVKLAVFLTDVDEGGPRVDYLDNNWIGLGAGEGEFEAS